jgi:hypothetical protein
MSMSMSRFRLSGKAGKVGAFSFARSTLCPPLSCPARNICVKA